LVKRIFLAFKIILSKEISKKLQLIFLNHHENQISWVDTTNMLVTIAFLGNCNDDVIRKIDNSVKDIVIQNKPFQLKISGIGMFDKCNVPNIVWIGFEKNDNLICLHKKLWQYFQSIGFKNEHNIFIPHATLGRIKRLNDLERFKTVLDEIQKLLKMSIVVYEIILFESVLSGSSPRYIELNSYNFSDLIL
jgi:RNA 2',3'-cyclic 3'-phosphodiesterase